MISSFRDCILCFILAKKIIYVFSGGQTCLVFFRPPQKMEEEEVCYTDGSTPSNGFGATRGAGVWLGEVDPRNVGEPIRRRRAHESKM